MKLLALILLLGFFLTVTPFNRLAAQTNEFSKILIKPTLKIYTIESSIDYYPLLWKSNAIGDKMTSYFRPMEKYKVDQVKTDYSYRFQNNNESEVECWKGLVGGIARGIFTMIAQ